MVKNVSQGTHANAGMHKKETHRPITARQVRQAVSSGANAGGGRTGHKIGRQTDQVVENVKHGDRELLD